MKTLVIRVDPENRKWWKDTLQKLLPNLKVVLWDEDEYKVEEVEYAVVWNPPVGGFKKFTNLKCVVSVGAGVDHILKDPDYPKNVPIIRTVGKPLRKRMAEYVLPHVSRYQLRLPEIRKAQEERKLIQYVEPLADEINVGVMGMGNLGGYLARKLRVFGYNVFSWSRTPKKVKGIASYAGKEQLSHFLSKVKILVCILPQTSLTENILNEQTFEMMPDGSYLINVGRGETIVEKDLIDALDHGKLAGATLDVFREEPLPKEHPFWKIPEILITCHTAGFIDPGLGGKIIAENLKKFIQGGKVKDIVDIEQGY